MTDLERVARALHHCQDPIAWAWEEKLPQYQDHMVCMARAAIEALMEPSDDVAVEGARSLRDTIGLPNFIPRAKACLQAQLRAVLDGGKRD